MPREDVRRRLLEAASSHEKVTYGELMRRFRISRGHPRASLGIKGVIGEIGRDERKNGRPGFGAIVVRCDTGYPGGGYFCYDDIPKRLRRDRAHAGNPRLSEDEKRFVTGEQRRIWDFYERHRRRS